MNLDFSKKQYAILGFATLFIATGSASVVFDMFGDVTSSGEVDAAIDLNGVYNANGQDTTEFSSSGNSFYAGVEDYHTTQINLKNNANTVVPLDFRTTAENSSEEITEGINVTYVTAQGLELNSTNGGTTEMMVNNGNVEGVRMSGTHEGSPKTSSLFVNASVVGNYDLNETVKQDEDFFTVEASELEGNEKSSVPDWMHVIVEGNGTEINSDGDELEKGNRYLLVDGAYDTGQFEPTEAFNLSGDNPKTNIEIEDESLSEATEDVLSFGIGSGTGYTHSDYAMNYTKFDIDGTSVFSDLVRQTQEASLGERASVDSVPFNDRLNLITVSEVGLETQENIDIKTEILPRGDN